MSRLKRLVQRFRQRGYKMTPQRRAILEVLIGNTSHPTAEQIHEAVRERMPDISLNCVGSTWVTGYDTTKSHRGITPTGSA
jgi:Fe2+ or Zn2+ uptake regulation protein